MAPTYQRNQTAIVAPKGVFVENSFKAWFLGNKIYDTLISIQEAGLNWR